MLPRVVNEKDAEEARIWALQSLSVAAKLTRQLTKLVVGMNSSTLDGNVRNTQTNDWNEIPPQQIFEVANHQKYRFLSEVGKHTITGEGNKLNFVRLPGRKSVKKNERTPTRKTNSRILPSRLRSNLESQSGKKTSKKQEFSRSEQVSDHPMIINQMQDLSRLTDLKSEEILTPKTGVRQGKCLKPDVSDNGSLSTKVEKNNSYLKRKIAYEFNFKDYFMNSDKVRYTYQSRMNIKPNERFRNKKRSLRSWWAIPSTKRGVNSGNSVRTIRYCLDDQNIFIETREGME